MYRVNSRGAGEESLQRHQHLLFLCAWIPGVGTFKADLVAAPLSVGWGNSSLLPCSPTPTRPRSGIWASRILFQRILSPLPDLCGFLPRMDSPDNSRLCGCSGGPRNQGGKRHTGGWGDRRPVLPAPVPTALGQSTRRQVVLQTFICKAQVLQGESILLCLGTLQLIKTQ